MNKIQYIRFLIYRFFIYAAARAGGKSNAYIDRSHAKAENLLQQEQRKKRVRAAQEAHKKKTLQPASITVSDPSAEGFRSFLDSLAKPDNRQSLFLSLLSTILKMANEHGRRMRVMFVSRIEMRSGAVEKVVNTSSMATFAENRWLPVRKDRLTLDEGHLLVREYANLMDQAGWICAHDAEKLYSDFVDSALIPAVSAATEASKDGSEGKAVALRVTIVSFDPANDSNFPCIEVSVTRYGHGAPSTVSLLIRFQRAAVALSA